MLSVNPGYRLVPLEKKLHVTHSKNSGSTPVLLFLHSPNKHCQHIISDVHDLLHTCVSYFIQVFLSLITYHLHIDTFLTLTMHINTHTLLIFSFNTYMVAWVLLTELVSCLYWSWAPVIRGKKFTIKLV